MQPTDYIYILGVIVVCFIAAGLSIYFILSIYSTLKGSPFVPTSSKEIDEILRRAHLKKDTLFMEFGSGDGRVVRRACSKYEVKGIGYEINPGLYWLSKIINNWRNLKNIQIIKKSFFDADISNADVLFLFLMPKTIKKISDHFDLSRRVGLKVISHGFKVQSLDSFLIDEIPTKPFSTYYYQIR